MLHRYDGRAPRYTSYPTAAQFTGEVGPATYARWLGALDHNELVSLYVHLPFCARLCWYCGCNTRVVRRGESISDYVRLLGVELDRVVAHLPGRLRASAIHLGGGTPNVTSTDDLAMLFGFLRRVFEVPASAEIAAELDPLHLTARWAAAAAGHGLTRASLGVQDLSPAVQAAVNRVEPFDVVARAFGLLRDVGVEAINVDLMYGLPRQRTADVLHTIDQVVTLRPQRIALFGYAHVPWMKPHQGLINTAELAGPEERLDQSQAAAERLAAAGYRPVGLDHFALPDDPLATDRAHRNFQGYTTDAARTLLGFGASAIGRLPQGYIQNQTSELDWRRAIGSGTLATAKGVAFTDDNRLRGEIIERLMCDFEVDLDAVCAQHGRDKSELEPALSRCGQFIVDGVIAIERGRLKVTQTGRPFVRSVCMAFDAYANPDALIHSLAV